MGIVHFGMLWPAAVLQLAAACAGLVPGLFPAAAASRMAAAHGVRGLRGCRVHDCHSGDCPGQNGPPRALHRPAGTRQDCTVVVLGCQVWSRTGTPSLMLRGRNQRRLRLPVRPSGRRVRGLRRTWTISEPITEAQCIREHAGVHGHRPRTHLSWRIASTLHGGKSGLFRGAHPRQTACPPMWPSPRTISTSCAAAIWAEQQRPDPLRSSAAPAPGS